jgi:hypothetical protein
VAVLVLLAGIAQAGPAPVVHVPPPEVGPSYPPAIVQRVIRQHREELRRCLAFEGRAHGELRVAFTIERDGRATHATATGPAASCVAWRIAQLTFPAPPGGAILFAGPVIL